MFTEVNPKLKYQLESEVHFLKGYMERKMQYKHFVTVDFTTRYFEGEKIEFVSLRFNGDEYQFSISENGNDIEYAVVINGGVGLFGGVSLHDSVDSLIKYFDIEFEDSPLNPSNKK